MLDRLLNEFMNACANVQQLKQTGYLLSDAIKEREQKRQAIVDYFKDVKEPT